MKGEEFRKIVFRYPFKPVRIMLEAGDPLIVKHPDFIHVVGDWGAVWEDGLPITFEVSRVVSIKDIRLANHKRRNGH